MSSSHLNVEGLDVMELLREHPGVWFLRRISRRWLTVTRQTLGNTNTQLIKWWMHDSKQTLVSGSECIRLALRQTIKTMRTAL